MKLTGYSSNLDGTAIHLTMAASHRRRDGTSLDMGEQIALPAFMIIASVSAAGVSGGPCNAGRRPAVFIAPSCWTVPAD